MKLTECLIRCTVWTVQSHSGDIGTGLNSKYKRWKGFFLKYVKIIHIDTYDDCLINGNYLTCALSVENWAILRSAHTVYLCVLCGSENKQRLFPYTTLTDWLLCVFAKLPKVSISFVKSPSVCPSVRTEQFDSNCTNFHYILYLIFLQKSVEKIKNSLRSYDNNRYFT
jgi:hypothetical protein